MSAGSGPNFSLSTPQNTPANAAPISSRAQQPGLGSVKEGQSRANLASQPNSCHEQSLTRLTEGDASDRAAAAAMFAQNPKLVSMIQGKLNTLVGQSSGYIEALPLPVRRRIVGLKGIQKEHSDLEAKFQEEVLELEKKYFAKFSPLYSKRADIINGKSEPTAAEIETGNKNNEDDEGKPVIKTEADGDEETTTDLKGVPEFWLTAMRNEPTLTELITDEDVDALKSLVDIRMEYLSRPGFKLIFEFASNDFFTNKTLSKTYFYQDEPAYGGDFVYDHADGDKIQWKADKDLTVKVETKRQRNKSELMYPAPSNPGRLIKFESPDTKQTRVVKKSVPTDSFFNFFDPPQPIADDEDDEGAEDLEERLELDYNIGEDIKEKLIPHAIDWFTGEAAQFENVMDDLDDAEFEDEDDEDDDDDEDGDEDDTEEEVDGPRSAKQDAAECKQS